MCFLGVSDRSFAEIGKRGPFPSSPECPVLTPCRKSCNPLSEFSRNAFHGKHVRTISPSPNRHIVEFLQARQFFPQVRDRFGVCAVAVHVAEFVRVGLEIE